MKLLNLTTRTYGVYLGLIILISIPLFYISLQRLFIKEVDESLALRKHKLQYYLNRLNKDVDIRQWQDLDGDIKVRLSTGPIGRDSLFQSTQYDSLTHEMEPFRELDSYIVVRQKPYKVSIRTSLLESRDLIYGIVELQVALLILLLLGMLLLNRRIAQRIWHPFYQTVDELKVFEVDKHSAIELPATSIQEFDDLNRAIIQLAQKSRVVYQSQKEFTENAAHEMQTPIAVLNGKLEMLLQSEELSENQATLIGSAMEVLERLSKLIKNLLLLAKIENKQFSPTESIDLSGVLNRLINQYQESITSKRLDIYTDLSPFFVQANVTLIDILLSNLLSNAIRHNQVQGQISIGLIERRLTIENSGKSSRLLSDRVFERFQKDPSNPHSTGLGLAIVKKIVDLYGWQIQYSTDTNRHTIQINF
ncbi:sensor histidine kinase [Spirosoma gilvum]